MNRKLQLAREIISCLCGMEVRIVSDQDGALTRRLRGSFPVSDLTLAADQRIEAFLAGLEPGCVYHLSGILGLSFILIRLPDTHQYLCAGPCGTENFSESKIRSVLRPHKLSDHQLRQIVSYCRWQPALSHEKLHQLGILLARQVLELPEPVAYRHIAYQMSSVVSSGLISPAPDAELSQIRQIEMRYESSAALTEAVKQGNLSMALRMIRGIYPGATSMIRNRDPLRNAQNMCIVLNTQLRHAMEERKIHPYRLDMVSSEIGRDIEKLKALEQVQSFCAHIIRRYCELALEKNYAHLEPFSRQAVVYIKNHLTDNLTVKATAEALLVNANYLSGKFHQQVGMTFTDFVNRERTEQAAALLRHTNMQVQQIASAVGYNNTSYFAKQFLRFHGVTPRQYRSTGQP